MATGDWYAKIDTCFRVLTLKDTSAPNGDMSFPFPIVNVFGP